MKTINKQPCTLWALALFGFLCLSACGEDAPSLDTDDAGTDGATSGPPAAIALGTGIEAFEPFPSSLTLPLTAGTQGGHHVWISVRVVGMNPKGLRLQMNIVPTPPARPNLVDVPIDFAIAPDPSAGFTHEMRGWPAQVRDAECAVGKPVQITVTLSDQAGKTLSQEVSLIPSAPAEGFVRLCRL